MTQYEWNQLSLVTIQEPQYQQVCGDYNNDFINIKVGVSLRSVVLVATLQAHAVTAYQNILSFIKDEILFSLITTLFHN